MKDKNSKQKEKSKNKGRVMDDDLKVGDPKKKVKISEDGKQK